MQDSDINATNSRNSMLVNHPPLPPTSLLLTCNSHDADLNVQDLAKILADPLFNGVTDAEIQPVGSVNSSDLTSAATTILRLLTRINSLSLGFNEFVPAAHEGLLAQVKALSDERHVSFQPCFNIGGIADSTRIDSEAIRRKLHMATVFIASALRIRAKARIRIHVDLSNAFSLPRFLEWADSRNIEITFRVSLDLLSVGESPTETENLIRANARSFLADFFGSDVLRKTTTRREERAYYQLLERRFSDESSEDRVLVPAAHDLSISCGGAIFHGSPASESFGNAIQQSAMELYNTENSHRILNALRYQFQVVSPVAFHRPPSQMAPLTDALSDTWAARKAGWLMQAIPVVAGLLTKLVTARQFEIPADKASGTKHARVVIVGAYGGEHVGDAAILGGVLKRLHDDYGVTSAVVASIRPHRTRRWVRTIHSPVTVDVVPYEDEVVRKQLDLSNSLVIAGGPLMDLPKLLNKHLSAAIHAKKSSKPLIIEGIGIGPFKNLLTKATATTLLKMADSIVVRSEADLKFPGLNGLAAKAKQDPAFDYLATRTGTLYPDPFETETLAALLSNTEGKALLGVNLRPLWSKFASKGHDINETMCRFVAELAEGLCELNSKLDSRLVVISFPMNPDLYGFSDLIATQMLDDKIAGRIEHRIWDAEPGIDAVLSLLLQMDAVLAMRFHACIFSLSQSVPTFGIDYSLGAEGKVAKLLREAGFGERLARMQSMQSPWVVDRLREHLEGVLSAKAGITVGLPSTASRVIM